MVIIGIRTQRSYSYGDLGRRRSMGLTVTVSSGTVKYVDTLPLERPEKVREYVAIRSKGLMVGFIVAFLEGYYLYAFSHLFSITSNIAKKTGKMRTEYLRIVANLKAALHSPGMMSDIEATTLTVGAIVLNYVHFIAIIHKFMTPLVHYWFQHQYALWAATRGRTYYKKPSTPGTAPINLEAQIGVEEKMIRHGLAQARMRGYEVF